MRRSIRSSLTTKAVLEVNDLHRGLITDQKRALEEYKLEQKMLFPKFRNDLQSVIQEPGVWLSFKAWVWAIIVFELLLLVVGFVVYFCAKAKFT